MGLIIFFFSIIGMCMVAASKGFNPLAWVFAGGLLGFIILLCMPSANATGIDEETKSKRKSNGNAVGGAISGIVILIIIVLGSGAV